jgi:hypothetical protein
LALLSALHSDELSVEMISELQTCTDLYCSESAPSLIAIWMKEWMEVVEGKIQKP